MHVPRAMHGIDMTDATHVMRAAKPNASETTCSSPTRQPSKVAEKVETKGGGGFKPRITQVGEREL